MMKQPRSLLAAAVLATAAIAAPAPSGDELMGVLRVSAAASLADVYSELATQFEEAHPGVDVILDVGASSTLAHRIIEGAPADVFASADLDSMARLVAAGIISGEPVIFATNTLAIAVEPGNPQGIGSLLDLAERPELIVVATAPEVPIGRYTQQLLDCAGITVEFDSYEENVRAVGGRIEIGEADAGIVYVTDISANPALGAVAVPVDANVVATYPVAITTEAADPVIAAAFITHVLGDDGQAVLAAAGFGDPRAATLTGCDAR